MIRSLIKLQGVKNVAIAMRGRAGRNVALVEKFTRELVGSQIPYLILYLGMLAGGHHR